MRKYRDRLSFICSLLAALEGGGATITEVMRKANVPHDRAVAELTRLIEAGLAKVENAGTRKVYSLTPEGRETLKRLEEARNYLLELGLL